MDVDAPECRDHRNNGVWSAGYVQPTRSHGVELTINVPLPIKSLSVFELLGEGLKGGSTPQLFSQSPLTPCQIMHWGVSYVLYT